MFRSLPCRMSICLAAVLVLATGCSTSRPPTEETESTRYEDLVSLFKDWRTFEKPELVDGVPDYTAKAMAEQHHELADYQRRLSAIDSTDWPVAQKVDHHQVRAEMNGLDFYHRVSRPWARNPAFYVMIFRSQSDVPAHEGPVLHGWIDLWLYDYPLVPEPAAELTSRLRIIPTLLEQARGNLIEDATDLWVMGIRAMTGQSRDLQALADRVAGTSAELDEAIQSAGKATDDFAAWLESESLSKSGPSGVGVDNYTWYMHNVHLVPYTWDDQVAMIRRELARSHSALRLEEHRNRKLPPLKPIETAEQYNSRYNDAVTEYIAFLSEEEILSVRDYYDTALRERIRRLTPGEGPRGFFSEVSYRDMLTMRTHGHHWFDLAMMANEPHPSPIRRVPSLYNIFDSRAEGLATGME